MMLQSNCDFVDHNSLYETQQVPKTQQDYSTKSDILRSHTALSWATKEHNFYDILSGSISAI